MQVSGNGTVTTPAVQLVTSGCYSYGDELGGERGSARQRSWHRASRWRR